MSSVVEFRAAGPETPRARLCEFGTGKFSLLANHQAWLWHNVVPLLKGSQPVYIRLWGYASKLGPDAANRRLSERRANAVKDYLQRAAGRSLDHVEVGAYGETRSSGPENDNSGLFRAVDVYIYQPPLPPARPLPPPPLRPPAVPQLYDYFGVFGKAALAARAGTQQMVGAFYSRHPKEWFVGARLSVSTSGLHLGGSAALALAVVLNAPDKRALRGLVHTQTDFAITLGGKWGDVLKLAKRAPLLAKIGQVAAKAATHKPLDILKGLKPEDIDEFINIIKAGLDSTGLDRGNPKPQLFTMDVPFAGFGLELGIFKARTEIYTVD